MAKSQTQSLTEDLPDTQTNKHSRRFNFSRTTLIIIALIVLVAGFSAWQYSQNLALKKELGQLKGDGGASDAEIRELVSKVGALIELPEGDEPTIATVTDPQKLTDQAFFATAKTGDKVLIYANAKKAILYRPSENKIIEVAPVNIGGATAEAEQQTESPLPVTERASVVVQVQNASKTNGLARKVSDTLRAAGFVQANASDAPAGVSATTTIIYGERYKAVANEINEVLGNSAKTEVQIGLEGATVILGTDFK